MRGNDIHRRAVRRVRSDHRDTACDEFETRLLQDGVHDDIIEDTQLALLEDAIATAEDARDRRREELADTDEDFAADIARSVEHIQGAVRRRIMEVCAERCRTVLVDGDEWVDRGWNDRDDVEAAKQESATWLLEHPDACERLWGERWHHEIPLDEEVTVDA